MSDRTSRRLYCIQRPDQTLIQKSVSDDPKLCWELALATDKRCAKYGKNLVGREDGLAFSIFRLKRRGYRRRPAKVVLLTAASN